MFTNDVKRRRRRVNYRRLNMVIVVVCTQRTGTRERTATQRQLCDTMARDGNMAAERHCAAPMQATTSTDKKGVWSEAGGGGKTGGGGGGGWWCGVEFLNHHNSCYSMVNLVPDPDCIVLDIEKLLERQASSIAQCYNTIAIMQLRVRTEAVQLPPYVWPAPYPQVAVSERREAVRERERRPQPPPVYATPL